MMVSQEVLMEFKRRFPNYGLPEKLPLVNGYIFNHLLVIKACPLCGYSHDHTVARNCTKKGYLTIRVAHCPYGLCQEYVIKVAGKLNQEQYNATSKRKENPRRYGNVKYIGSSEYITTCEERSSWI